MSDQVKNDFKPGDELTSAHLNAMGTQIKQNAQDVAAAQQAAAEAKAAAEAASAETGAKAEAEAAAAAAAQVAADLEANAQADAAIAEQVQTNIAAIEANATKAQEALDAIASNAEADAAVRALAEANKALIEANSEADAQLAAKVGNIEQDYVSKTDTKTGFKAQTLYNVTTYKYEDANVQTLAFNESDGGGNIVHNKTLNIKAFIGVNDAQETGGVWGQFYAKNVTTNVGTRVNFTDTGVFYTKDKANGAFTADDELQTKADVAAAVNSLSIPEDQSAAVAALAAQVTALEKALDAKNFGVAADLSEGTVSVPGKAITLSSAQPVTQATTVTAKSVTSDDLDVESSVVKVDATDVVNFTNLSVTGAYDKSTQGNAQMLVTGSDVVRFIDAAFTATGYNQIEIHAKSGAAPSNIQIENCRFEGASNVPVQIHATAENAVVTIKNCVFGPTSNPIRFSNTLNVSGVVVNIENCEFQGLDANEAYKKIILLQDYTSTTAEEAETNNLFAPEKLTINFINCTLGNGPVTESHLVGNENGLGDLVYVYRDKGEPAQIAYDETKFPTVTVK